jgi:Phytanoyl-CoA dioxygenase (PhyH)
VNILSLTFRPCSREFRDAVVTVAGTLQMPDTLFDQHPSSSPTELSRILEHAERLAAAGDFRQAIDFGTAANRKLGAPELERRLMFWRANAFPTMDHSAPKSSWPPRIPDPFPGLVGLPEVDISELSVEIIGGAFQHHGALLVHNVATREEADHLRAGIDRAIEARNLFYAGAPEEQIGSWYGETPLNTPTGSMRGWGGSLWMADSPRMMYDVLSLYEQRGVTSVITKYLQEPLTLSIGKSTLRRMEPGGPPHDWHQDGAFLGEDVRTVNVWLSLSDCGIDAPGLDIVAKRLPGVVQTGSHGAQFHWSVGAGLVDMLEGEGTPIISPVFQPGDALFFDQLMLHRTAVRPEMTKNRWAIESWFFTPSTFPLDQGPLMV